MKTKIDIAISEVLKRKLTSAESVVALTGAGISAESGVPTFRGAEGLWKKFKPEELASFDAFMRNPDLVWEWYRYRRKLVSKTQPNPGHYALAEMEKLFPRFAIVTQNVDNLHRRAGSRNIFELHGNIERNYCVSCGKYATDDAVLAGDHIPRCVSCGGIIRPDVVWFGEALPVDAWNDSVDAAGRADIFFSVGTSAIVYPAASLPSAAKKAGAYVVEINIEPTDLSHKADEVILAPSSRALPKILEYCRKNGEKGNSRWPLS